ncbi:Crp/Fnr family transcriptional regulator [Puia dinghuensis]|uniref:Cyclic nucleotide-binding protein n=1 Tax=Puia dinghuensis TaxID=1792502 RepID=A0A8J2XR55_9BACT|nr:Crp/Fnr family transcriptional regulator [Puia dinghuensis]GGA98539.1 cyclic nucleotide-binding protein [Puia dinghuensis]
MTNPLIERLQSMRPIPAGDRELIGEAWQARSYEEGDDLFRGGTVCRELFFICDGILRIVMTNEEGEERTHFFLKENQFCTILRSFENQTAAEERIQAACKATVSAITRDRLLGLYAEIPYLQLLIDRLIHHGLLDKITIRNSYLGHDAAARYKLFLTQQPDIASRVSLSDIASYLGITPQSLSRIRRTSIK